MSQDNGHEGSTEEQSRAPSSPPPAADVDGGGWGDRFQIEGIRKSAHSINYPDQSSKH